MMRQSLKIFLLLIVISFGLQDASASGCKGKFVNPITDICWDCLFPISIGAIEMPPSTPLRPDTANFPSPICICPKAGVPIPGLAIGMWEPFRMVDVTKRPFCMTSIGGIELNPGLPIGGQAAPFENESEGRIGNWHVHWYINPLASILGLFTDAMCQRGNTLGFDLAYMTEFDPLWNNDLLSFIINPEAILFGNIIAQAACAADCIASTVWKPLDVLFWCAGCQGSSR